MTKPAPPASDVVGEIVEINAMDLAEWEHDQRTPQTSDANLAALLERTATAPDTRSDGSRNSAEVARAIPTTPIPPRPRGSDAPPKTAAAAKRQTPRASNAVAIPTIPPRRVPTEAPREDSGKRGTAGGASTGGNTGGAASPGTGDPSASGSAGNLGTSGLRTASIAGNPGSAGHRGAGNSSTAGIVADHGAIPSRRANTATPTRPLATTGIATPREPATERDPFGADAVTLQNRRMSPRESVTARGSTRSPTHKLAEPSLASAAPVQEVTKQLRVPQPARTTAVPHGLTGREPSSSAPAQGGLEAAGIPLPLPAPMESSRTVMPHVDPWGAPPSPLFPSPPPSSPPPPAVQRLGTQERPSTDVPDVLAAPARRPRWWLRGAVAGTALIGAAFAVAIAGGPDRDPAAPVASRAASSRPDVRGVATPAPPEAPPAAVAGPAATPSPLPAAAAAVAPPPAASDEKPSPVAGETAVAGKPVPPRPARRLGGKKLVVEYGGNPSEAAPGLVAQAAEDPAVARARSAYVSGNQKLFAGDVDAAIAAYRQAIVLYPGYVGGYRGLGLAYAQRGDSLKALDAFKTYVSAVPGAKDVELIKKRIARLQGK